MDRVPRYFDPESEWEKRAQRCYRCGKPGHKMRDCPYDEKQKPCFLCGKFGHLRSECPNQLCFKCNKPGHQARDCREAMAVHKICMRCGSRNCGNAGNAKYSARNCSFEYHSKDLELVTCVEDGRKGYLSPPGGQESGKRKRGADKGSRFITCAACGEDTHHHSECGYAGMRQRQPHARQGRRGRYDPPRHGNGGPGQGGRRGGPRREEWWNSARRYEH